MKNILCLLFAAAMIFMSAGCKSTTSESSDKTVKPFAPAPESAAVEFGPALTKDELASQQNKVFAEITMENGGVMKMELYPDIAPVTVENFKKLVEDKFYDGLTFHRIIEGFMIQGGDPEGTGMGGSDEKIKGEFASNGVKNNITHARGTVSMARSQSPDSASSQFFIVHQDSDFLDGEYAAFGQLVSGFEVLDELAGVEVEDGNGTVAAVNQPVIKNIRIVE